MNIIRKHLEIFVFTGRSVGLEKKEFCPLPSFPRRRESSIFNWFWTSAAACPRIPLAAAGVTVLRTFFEFVMYQRIFLSLLSIPVFLSSCGSLTGLPGHGGGKRFAIEQELVAASARGALKQIDLSILRGKNVNLFVNAIGDTGAGNLTGGRLSVVSQLRGDYIQTPPTTENSVFPNYKTTTSATSGATSSTSQTDTVVPYPEAKQSRQKGSGGVGQGGVEYKGLGEYRNSETLFGSSDLQYFTALLHTYLFLKGVHVVPPSEAEIDIHVTIDIFGTVRSRVEWFLANNEILKARTNFEILAIEHTSGQLVMPPQAVGAEAEYNEQYVLWAGPVSAGKFMKKADPPLCDFTDLPDEKAGLIQSAEKAEPVPYPFRHQVEDSQKEK
jgi:hypothetical protein